MKMLRGMFEEQSMMSLAVPFAGRLESVVVLGEQRKLNIVLPFSKAVRLIVT